VHVAGTISAVTNNSLGVVGISPGVSLMIGKMWGAGSGGGGYEKLMACMLDSANLGARIISLSVGGTMDWKPLKETMDYLYDKGVFVTACAGNDFETGNNPWYPAAYNTTLAVTNIDQNDERFFASNIGDYIDIAAPGSDIWSTVRGGGYESWYGCSMATPVVSGLAALMMSAKPDITPRELMDLFTSTAVDLGEPGKDSTFGHGRIDPLAAARKLLNIADIPTDLGFRPTPVTSTPIVDTDVSIYSSGIKVSLSYFGTLLISFVPILLL
jgi:subtilisin family serine protease